MRGRRDPKSSRSESETVVASGDILGSFRIGERLGAGAMGTVYRAVQTTLGRPVVVKMLHPHLAADDDLIARFEREARHAAHLQHPNTVQVIEFGQTGDDRYLVMEYVEGMDLKDVLKIQGAFPIAIALLILRDISRGLEAAHSREIVHRDIKPANLMLTRQGVAKVMDFGLARETAESSTLTAAGAVMGSPAYMSPEQARGESVDPRTDIFSTGLVAYELLAGHRAFPGDSYAMVLHHVLNDPIPPLREIAPDLPVDVCDLIAWMTVKSQAERCPSMGEARDRLEAMIEDFAIRRPEAMLAEFLEGTIARRNLPQSAGRAIAPTASREGGPVAPPGDGSGSPGATDVATRVDRAQSTATEPIHGPRLSGSSEASSVTSAAARGDTLGRDTHVDATARLPGQDARVDATARLPAEEARGDATAQALIDRRAGDRNLVDSRPSREELRSIARDQTVPNQPSKRRGAMIAASAAVLVGAIAGGIAMQKAGPFGSSGRPDRDITSRTTDKGTILSDTLTEVTDTTRITYPAGSVEQDSTATSNPDNGSSQKSNGAARDIAAMERARQDSIEAHRKRVENEREIQERKADASFEVTYSISTKPYAVVTVDDDPHLYNELGNDKVTLKVGRHRFRLVNASGLDRTLTYEVVPGDLNRVLVLDAEAGRVKARVR